MNNYIIPRSAQVRKSVDEFYPATDLICPQLACCSGCYCSSPATRVWCPTCGWAVTLTTEQTTELTEALLGISDLPIAQYLIILDTQRDASTPLSLRADAAISPAYRVEGGAA